MIRFALEAGAHGLVFPGVASEYSHLSLPERHHPSAAAQLQHGFDLGEKQSFTYGADYIWTNPRTGGTINGGNELVDNVTEYGAYIQSSTKPIKQVELLLAARADGNSVIAGQFFHKGRCLC